MISIADNDCNARMSKLKYYLHHKILKGMVIENDRLHEVA